jgi:hypothetical protein
MIYMQDTSLKKRPKGDHFKILNMLCFFLIEMYIIKCLSSVMHKYLLFIMNEGYFFCLWRGNHVLIHSMICFHFCQVEQCLRLLKKFPPKNFKEQTVKFGRKCQITEQLVEIPIDHQMYDMIDIKGSEGLLFKEVSAYITILVLFPSTITAFLPSFSFVFLAFPLELLRSINV